MERAGIVPPTENWHRRRPGILHDEAKADVGICLDGEVRGRSSGKNDLWNILNNIKHNFILWVFIRVVLIEEFLFYPRVH